MAPNPKHPDYLHPYHQAVRRHGASFHATLWASRESQRARFRVLTEMMSLAGRSIVDAGCAIGDFAAYLAEHNILYGHYTGLDAVPELLAEARARDLPRATFLDIDFVADEAAFTRFDAPPDVIAFSGSLNTLEQDHAAAILERAWPAAGHALLFNFLSARDGRPPLRDELKDLTAPPDPAQRFDPIDLLDWALTKTPNVRFRQDYLKGHDATIAMLR